jgi:hypothetical protein
MPPNHDQRTARRREGHQLTDTLQALLLVVMARGNRHPVGRWRVSISEFLPARKFLVD